MPGRLLVQQAALGQMLLLSLGKEKRTHPAWVHVCLCFQKPLKKGRNKLTSLNSKACFLAFHVNIVVITVTEDRLLLGRRPFAFPWGLPLAWCYRVSYKEENKALLFFFKFFLLSFSLLFTFFLWFLEESRAKMLLWLVSLSHFPGERIRPSVMTGPGSDPARMRARSLISNPGWVQQGVSPQLPQALWAGLLTSIHRGLWPVSCQEVPVPRVTASTSYSWRKPVFVRRRV